MKFHCMGVKVDVLTRKEWEHWIHTLQCRDKPQWVVTLNPEIVLTAKERLGYRDTLNKSSLSLIDGYGLLLALWLFHGVRGVRLCGSDILVDILKKCESEQWCVGVVLPQKTLVSTDEVREWLSEKYSLRSRVFQLSNAGILAFDVECDVLIVCLGAPMQEEWIARNMRLFSGIQLCIGVGGAFDMLLEKKRRAPKFLRSIGFEWFWRLILEPRYRFRRIARAVFLFPFHALSVHISRCAIIYEKNTER